MSNTPAKNGTVSVATLQDKSGRYFLAAIHVDRDGRTEIVGMDYVNMDEAKSAAWAYAQQHVGVTMISTTRTGARS